MSDLNRLDELEAERDRLRADLEAETNRADEAEATVQRVRDFAEQMRHWCSPYGIASDYAARLLTALDGTEGGS